MTHPDAQLSVINIIQMLFAIGVPLCMVAGWKEPVKKKAAGKKRSNVRAKPTLIGGSVLKASPKAKTKSRRLKSKPLSFEDQRRVDDYFIRKYNIVSFSNIPL